MAKIAVRLKNPGNKYTSENKKVVITGREIHMVEEDDHVKKAIAVKLLEKVPASDLPAKEEPKAAAPTDKVPAEKPTPEPKKS